LRRQTSDIGLGKWRQACQGDSCASLWAATKAAPLKSPGRPKRTTRAAGAALPNGWYGPTRTV